jgi:hypothetical protein
MRTARSRQLRLARDAVDALVAALREHDVQGHALRLAVKAAAAVRRRLARGRVRDPEKLQRFLEHVKSACAARDLDRFAPVRNALTAFSVASRDDG